MSKIKIGDTVRVTAGTHKGRIGTIETKRSVAWVVVFGDRQDPRSAQLSSSQLRKVEVAS